MLHDDNQLNAAEKIASRAINLIPKKGSQSLVCESHRLLGNTYQSKRDTEKAFHNFEVALRIASSFNWHDHLIWIHHDLAQLLLDEGRFADAHAHIEGTEPHAINSAYNLGLAMELRAKVWYKQRRLEEARSEVLRGTNVYEKLGAVKDAGGCRRLLRRIGGKS